MIIDDQGDDDLLQMQRRQQLHDLYDASQNNVWGSPAYREPRNFLSHTASNALTDAYQTPDEAYLAPEALQVIRQRLLGLPIAKAGQEAQSISDAVPRSDDYEMQDANDIREAAMQQARTAMRNRPYIPLRSDDGGVRPIVPADPAVMNTGYNTS
jgi:hypothetical protein